MCHYTSMYMYMYNIAYENRKSFICDQLLVRVVNSAGVSWPWGKVHSLPAVLVYCIDNDYFRLGKQPVGVVGNLISCHAVTFYITSTTFFLCYLLSLRRLCLPEVWSGAAIHWQNVDRYQVWLYVLSFDSGNYNSRNLGACRHVHSPLCYCKLTNDPRNYMCGIWCGLASFILT